MNININYNKIIGTGGFGNVFEGYHNIYKKKSYNYPMDNDYYMGLHQFKIKVYSNH